MTKKLYELTEEHEQQLKPWADVLPPEISARVIAKLVSGCWLVKPNSGNCGYLRFTHRRHTNYAHRVVYAACCGPIPKGMVIDHRCRNRACVNPQHLELVSYKENVQRGLRGSLIKSCPQGHSYTPENTLIKKEGHRRCRICHAARERAAKRWRKAS